MTRRDFEAARQHMLAMLRDWVNRGIKAALKEATWTLARPHPGDAQQHVAATIATFLRALCAAKRQPGEDDRVIWCPDTERTAQPSYRACCHAWQRAYRAWTSLPSGAKRHGSVRLGARCGQRTTTPPARSGRGRTMMSWCALSRSARQPDSATSR